MPRSKPPNFKMKKPCENCPFRKEGSIDLMPGRLPGIIETLEDDHNFFQCHKTTYGAAPVESICMGSVAWLLKNRGRTGIYTRLGLMAQDITIEDIEACYPLLKEEEDIT